MMMIMMVIMIKAIALVLMLTCDSQARENLEKRTFSPGLITSSVSQLAAQGGNRK